MSRSEKNICIFGSTGSIGSNTLTVIDNLNKNGKSLRVKYLTAGKNIGLLAEQVEKFMPEAVVIADKDSYSEFRKYKQSSMTEVLCGESDIVSIANDGHFDLAVNSLTGFSGLFPTIATLSSGKNIALANKETLVSAGALVSRITKENESVLYPIDSEHSAILQCILGEKRHTIEKVVLTASGGPFLDTAIEQMSDITVEDALKHPNWKMGKKITIDSATMMNKGLEVIEAKWLYDLRPDQIEVIIHPQSIVHSFVEFCDGSVKAQLGVPDMRIPIQYALTYPDRVTSDFPRVDFGTMGDLQFRKPDLNKFRCLQIAYDALCAGMSYPAVMNSANEYAVNLFLDNKIEFLDIPTLIEKEIQKHEAFEITEPEQLIELDVQTKENILKNARIMN